MWDALGRVVGAAVIFLWLFSGHANAQTLYGSMVGTVTDPSGAAIPSAKVVVANTETAFMRLASTDERGSYLFSDLQPGPYEIKVAAGSFAAFSRTGVQVSVNAVVRVDVQLALPSAVEAITVAGSAVVLQSETAEVRTEVTTKELQDLPMLGNNYQTLFQALPARRSTGNSAGRPPPRRISATRARVRPVHRATRMGASGP